MANVLNVSTYKWMLIFFNIPIIAYMFILIKTKWNELPDQIPSHFNCKGEIDGKSKKGMLYLLPCVSIFITITIISINFTPEKYVRVNTVKVKNEELSKEAKRKIFSVSNFLTAIILLITNIFINYTLVCSINIKNINVYALILYLISIGFIIGILFFVIKYYAKQTKPSDKKE